MESLPGVRLLENGLGLENGIQPIIPQPRSGVGEVFKDVIDGVRGATGAVAETIGQINPEYANLITQQMEAQRQMQLVTLVSNVEKSRHETQMGPIRNIRVG